MGSKANGDAKLRRLGQASYKEIIVPQKRAPIPNRMEARRVACSKTYPGIQFAREPLPTREIIKVLGQGCKSASFQHIVASSVIDETATRGDHPWKWSVVARCKAKLRRAAVKVGRQFLELDVCPKCWKTVPADG